MCQTDGDFLWIKNNIASLYIYEVTFTPNNTLFKHSFFFWARTKRVCFVWKGLMMAVGKRKFQFQMLRLKLVNKIIGTNRNGEFQIKIHYESELSVVFSHVGFKSYSQQLTDKIVKRKIVGDTLYWNNIVLLEKTLIGMTVLSHRVDTVFGSTRYSVEDYSLLPAGDAFIGL